MVGKETFARTTQSLSFTLEHRVTDKSIQALLTKLYNAAGCRNCGLVGYDVHLHVVDPASRAQFQDIEGLLDVSSLAGVR